MKLFVKVGLLLALVFTLAACDSNDAAVTPAPATDDNETVVDPTPATDTTTDTNQTAFTAQITGAEEKTVNGGGYFLCEGEIDEINISASAALSNNVLFTLPRDSAAGTYAIDNMSIQAMYVSDNISEGIYDSVSSGSITLDAIATASGEKISGRFEFTAANSQDESKEVTVTGTFDFAASSISFHYCEA